MHRLDKSIIDAFKKFEGKELTTSEVVKFVFPDDANTFDIDSGDILFIGGEKKVKTSVRYKKSLLHKRLLYHLNKLVKQSLLKLSGIEEFGEKRFSLSEDYDLELDKSKNNSVLIRNNINPVTPIEGYELKRIVRKLHSTHWINRLDAVLLNSKRFQSITKLSELLIDLFDDVNDCIAINSFESLLQDKEENSIEENVRKISADCTDYNKTVVFIIDVDNIFDKEKVKDFIILIADLNNDNMQVIFEVDSESLTRNNVDLFKCLIEEFSSKKIKVNIKNKSICNVPVFFGKAGVYSFDEREWKLYEKEFADKTFGASCCSSTLIVDVLEFFNNYSNAHEFREFILKANKALLVATVNKIKVATHYFRTINKANKPYSNEFYSFERNYIRFWNYNFKLLEEGNNLLDLFKTLKEKTEEFYLNEETIYKACGIPIRFKVVFSSAFRKSDLTMTQRTYKKTTIQDISYFDSPETISYLKIRERLLKVFTGLDRIRFFRSSNLTPKDVINEFSYILQNFNLPLVTYDFANIKGNTKLTSFFNVPKKKRRKK
jgi:hypothetical protein